jgi:hypothetical protein
MWLVTEVCGLNNVYASGMPRLSGGSGAMASAAEDGRGTAAADRCATVRGHLTLMGISPSYHSKRWSHE